MTDRLTVVRTLWMGYELGGKEGEKQFNKNLKATNPNRYSTTTGECGSFQLFG
jgi:hypothetical protein